MAAAILIWGAGAIGGTLGAYWARAGIDVQMVDINAEHADACSKQGLTIEGPLDNFTQVAIVANIGKEAGVGTPALRRLVELIHDIENGRRDQSFATLQELASVCV